MRLDPSLEKFSGILPLFPLPNVVFFPGTRLPLHIFEPRYRQMLLDAHRGERLLGIVLLKDGWDKDYFGRPAIHKVACVGKLTRVERLPSGRYNIQLIGLCRVSIESELESSKPYRLAKVKLLRDQLDEMAEVRSADLLQKAFGAFNRVLRKYSGFPGQLLTRHHKLPVGLLLDVLAHHVPAPPELKQRMLEEQDVFRRGKLIVDTLEAIAEGKPPEDGSKFWLFPKPSSN